MAGKEWNCPLRRLGLQYNNHWKLSKWQKADGNSTRAVLHKQDNKKELRKDNCQIIIWHMNIKPSLLSELRICE